ncbi:MAG: HAD family hydrolase [Oscillospiraceae bacterium]|nr:HAD family hydrolase [Oscillospiraceae bacterium]
MGKHSETDNVQPKAAAFAAPNALDGIVVIRLIIAALLFAVALIAKLPGVVTFIMLILAAAVAGYDVALAAVNEVEKGNYFAAPILILFVTVLAFIIGFPLEGAAMVMLYKIGLALIAYAEDRTRRTARELFQYQDESMAERAAILMEGEKAGETRKGAAISAAAEWVLRIVVVFALLFAVIVPIFTSLRFTSAIHRALIILLVASPLSAVAALPLSGIMGIGFSAQYGMLFNNARTLEKVGDAKTAIIDKNGVFSDASPKLVDVQPEILDKKTFMDFAAHAAYYSEQPFAKAIAEAYEQEYKLELVSDFEDIPGCGVDLKIGGEHVALGTKELYAGRGEALPFEQENGNLIYYLTVSDRYVGKIVIADRIHAETAKMIPALKESGVQKCILLSEEGKEESERLGLSLDVDEVYAECDIDKKLRLIENLSNGHNDDVMYVYSSGIESHSAAGVDIRVSQRSKFADAMIMPEELQNFPMAVSIGQRIGQINAENAVFAFAIKAILIFLGMTGRCTLWFAMFLDMAAALATILNTIRVTQPPLIDLSGLLNGKDEEDELEE